MSKLKTQYAKQISTQEMKNSTLPYPVKMEYGCNFTNFGVNMMVKSDLEKYL